MGHLSVWKVLDQMIADLRKGNVPIPDKIMNDLKSAKTVLNTPKTPSDTGEALTKIDAYLANVESCLVSEGEKRFGKQYSDEWLKKLDKASREANEEEERERFVHGLPREHKWVRIKSSNDLPIEKLKNLANESNVSCRRQKDDYLLVYGKDEHIKDFVKKMTTERGSRLKK